MKYLFLFSVLLGPAGAATAQSNQPVCGIYYDYDALGNRVKRSHDCRVHPDPNASEEGPGPGSDPNSRLAPASAVTPVPASRASDIQVYPNPTSGPYTIALSEVPEKPVHFHWYNGRGQILTSGTITGRETLGSISAWPDGTYLLQVYAPGGTKAFRIIKLTSSR